jgi:hypothetical protein
MPATEKTWRDQALMHVIFGVSSLVMLVGTIWMLAKDHNREWRRWQLDDRDRKRWTTEAQLAQAEADSSARLANLRDQLAAAQRTKIDAQYVERFKQLVEAENARLELPESDFRDVDEALAELESSEDRYWLPSRSRRRNRRSPHPRCPRS